jgi:hypothetical protein
MKSKLLGACCVAVLCITLTLGLWPFHSPRNDVAWLKGANGLAFGKYGTVFSRDPLKPTSSQIGASGSVEIEVQPELRDGSATILSFYRAGEGRILLLRQSLTDLEVHDEFPNESGGTTKAHFYVDDALGSAFRQKKPTLIAVTSGPNGTMVYLDGALAKAARGFRIPDGAFGGKLIVGDSPRQPDSFRGQIRGLAIYGLELDDAQVLRHYQTWTKNGRPDIAEDEANIALYLFHEHEGNAIHNHAAAGDDLYIPEIYTVIDKVPLEPLWKEFNWSGSYWRGNLKNIVGFMPLGFCFYAFFMIAWPIRRAVPVTVALGVLVSLVIEVLQIFLPSRDSGTTDLITNTLGTYLGVLCYRRLYLGLAGRFPLLSWFAPDS